MEVVWLIIVLILIGVIWAGILDGMAPPDYHPDPEMDKKMLIDNGMTEKDADFMAYDAQHCTKKEYLKRFPNG